MEKALTEVQPSKLMTSTETRDYSVVNRVSRCSPASFLIFFQHLPRVGPSNSYIKGSKY